MSAGGPGSLYLVSAGQGGMLEAMVARALATRQRAGALEPPGRKLRVVASHVAAAEEPRTLAYMRKRSAALFAGTELTELRVPGEPDAQSAEESRAALAAADLVFVAGGDPAYGARLLASSGAGAWLAAAHARGADFLGVSAGAMLFGAMWASWPDGPDEGEVRDGGPFDGGELVPCIGLLPRYVIDCHAELDGWEELALVRAMARAHHPTRELVFLGLPTNGALVVEPDGREEVVGDAPFRMSAEAG